MELTWKDTYPVATTGRHEFNRVKQLRMDFDSSNAAFVMASPGEANQGNGGPACGH